MALSSTFTIGFIYVFFRELHITKVRSQRWLYGVYLSFAMYVYKRYFLDRLAFDVVGPLKYDKFEEERLYYISKYMTIDYPIFIDAVKSEYKNTVPPNLYKYKGMIDDMEKMESKKESI